MDDVSSYHPAYQSDLWANGWVRVVWGLRDKVSPVHEEQIYLTMISTMNLLSQLIFVEESVEVVMGE